MQHEEVTVNNVTVVISEFKPLPQESSPNQTAESKDTEDQTVKEDEEGGDSDDAAATSN